MVLVAIGGLAPLWGPLWVLEALGPEQGGDFHFFLPFLDIRFLWAVGMKGQWERVGPVLCCVLSGCLALSGDTCWEIDHVFLLFVLLQLGSIGAVDKSYQKGI